MDRESAPAEDSRDEHGRTGETALRRWRQVPSGARGAGPAPMLVGPARAGAAADHPEEFRWHHAPDRTGHC